MKDLVIADIGIRQDADGRFSLNDLHRAAGGEKRHGPAYWRALPQTKALEAELETTGIPVVTVEGRNGGTYVARELVYAYAMWISPSFNLKVIRAYDASVSAKPSFAELLRIETRAEGKEARLALTDVVAEFVEYATKQGSSSAKMYYTNITMMEYRALFLVGKAVGSGFRDRLTAMQNMMLAAAEKAACNALREGMEQDMPYRDIYQLAKHRVETMGGYLGKTAPGQSDGELATAA